MPSQHLAPPSASRWRRTLLTLEVLLIGILGAGVGLLLAGRLTAGVGPFEARMSLSPSWSGGTQVALPPLGELRLSTHRGPLHLNVEVVRLREDEAREIVRDPDRLTGLGAEVQRDLTLGLLRLALQAGAATVVGATVLGFLVFRANRRTLLAGTTGLATLMAATGLTYLTFDEDALAEPRYSGLLAVAPSAVGDVRSIVSDFGTYTRSLGKIVTNVTDLYAVTSTLPTFEPDDATIRLLHVSDLHLSPIGFQLMASVAQQFGVQAIVDTGDMTDFGSAAETRYIDGVRDVGVPYVFVKGNHDSDTSARALRARGATVLQAGQPQTVVGVRFLGSPDPRFTPDKSTGDDDAPAEVLEAQGQELADRIDAGAPADVVLVHDPKAATPLLGKAPLVLAGHSHRRRSKAQDGTLLMVQGSTGGAGLRGLEGEEPTPLQMTVLYLDPGTRKLVAYDMLTLGGLGTSSAQIERRVVPPEDVAAGGTATPATRLPGPSASPSPR